jgi:hypothetical protein
LLSGALGWAGRHWLISRVPALNPDAPIAATLPAHRRIVSPYRSSLRLDTVADLAQIDARLIQLQYYSLDLGLSDAVNRALAPDTGPM